MIEKQQKIPFHNRKQHVRRFRRLPRIAHLYVQCSFKNTLISLTNFQGKVSKQWSTKALKKSHLKKNTPYNVQLLSTQINKFLLTKGFDQMNVFLKGTGLGRYNILKNIHKQKISIKYIIDKTAIPFNGCRQKKQKRK